MEEHLDQQDRHPRPRLLLPHQPLPCHLVIGGRNKVKIWIVWTNVQAEQIYFYVIKQTRNCLQKKVNTGRLGWEE